LIPTNQVSTKVGQLQFEDLLTDRCGDRVRLEQARIGYGWLETALREWLSMA